MKRSANAQVSDTAALQTNGATSDHADDPERLNAGVRIGGAIFLVSISIWIGLSLGELLR